MPLSKIQSDILRLPAAQRDPESYVAGATSLDRDGVRYSNDIDIFHDREERVAAAAAADTQVLAKAGYQIDWLRRFPTIQSAAIRRDNLQTRLEWVADSDFRYFPTIKDELFGYILHPVDLALNKVMAAAGRRALRDLVDLMTIHQMVLPLGALVWAAVEIAPGFTSEGLIAEIRRNAQYPAAEWKLLETSTPLDPVIVTTQLRAALEEAETFVSRIPSEKAGLLFLEGIKIVQPDPARLDEYRTHAGQRRGHWPSSPEISAAMFERYASLISGGGTK